MPLNTEILKNKFKEKNNGESNFLNVHENYALSISEHILKDSLLIGNYIGVLGNGSADPQNGKHKWKCISCSMKGKNISDIINGISEHEKFLSTFNLAIASEIKSKSFFGEIAIDAPVKLDNLVKILEIEIDIDMSTKPNDFDSANYLIADGIIKGIKKAVPQISMTAITTGGKGIVTFTNIE